MGHRWSDLASALSSLVRASLVALAIMSSLALAGVLQPALSVLCELLRDVLACAGGGRMCWSVKRSLIVRVLQLRGLHREDVPGYTDAAVRVFEELIVQVPSRLAEAQKWGLEGHLKTGFRGQPFTYAAAWHTHTNCLLCAPYHPHGVRCLTGRDSCVRQIVHRSWRNSGGHFAVRRTLYASIPFRAAQHTYSSGQRQPDCGRRTLPDGRATRSRALTRSTTHAAS